MNIKDHVVCKFAGCNQVLTDPRILPCGQRTCAAHIDAMRVKVETNNCYQRVLNCQFCGKVHQFPDDSENFPVDPLVLLVLSMKHSDEHEAAKKSFNELTKLFDELTKHDDERYVNDYYAKVEADVLRDKEVKQQELLDHYQKLVDSVQDRKAKCLHNLKTNKQLECELNRVKQKIQNGEQIMKHKRWDFQLKTVDGDAATWKEIQRECQTFANKAQHCGKELNTRIIADQAVKFTAANSCFQVKDVFGILDTSEAPQLNISTHQHQQADATADENASTQSSALSASSLRDTSSATTPEVQITNDRNSQSDHQAQAPKSKKRRASKNDAETTTPKRNQLLDEKTVRSIDSTILISKKMKRDLVELCQISGKEFVFKLLYRASRDGFDAKSFHDKCDHNPGTLTVIKTTKGYVFGGYTFATWDGDGCWKSDMHTSLFSLINMKARPVHFFMRWGNAGIHCNSDTGPVFGYDEIHIKSNSNSSYGSFSKLDTSIVLEGYTVTSTFLAGARHFQTTEIEVFQLL